MQLAYPTRPLERDCACETQLFPFRPGGGGGGGGGGESGTKLQTQGRWGGSIFGRDAV